MLPSLWQLCYSNPEWLRQTLSMGYLLDHSLLETLSSLCFPLNVGILGSTLIFTTTWVPEYHHPCQWPHWPAAFWCPPAWASELDSSQLCPELVTATSVSPVMCPTGVSKLACPKWTQSPPLSPNLFFRWRIFRKWHYHFLKIFKLKLGKSIVTLESSSPPCLQPHQWPNPITSVTGAG